VQLRLRIDTPDLLTVERLGRASLFHNEDANPTDRIQLRAGDTLRVGSQLLFLATMHPLWLPPLDAPPSLIGFPLRLGRLGLVGESRWPGRCASASPSRAAVGTRAHHRRQRHGQGKVARAIHGLARRARWSPATPRRFPRG